MGCTPSKNVKDSLKVHSPSPRPPSPRSSGVAAKPTAAASSTVAAATTTTATVAAERPPHQTPAPQSIPAAAVVVAAPAIPPPIPPPANNRQTSTASSAAAGSVVEDEVAASAASNRSTRELSASSTGLIRETSAGHPLAGGTPVVVSAGVRQQQAPNPAEDDNNDPAADENTNSAIQSAMVTTVRTGLDDWNLTYEVVDPAKLNNPNIPLIKFDMAGTYTTCTVILSMDLEDDVFSVYYTLPLKVPEDRRRAAAQFLAAANYQVLLGHFDLDFRDGEVRFKHSVIVQGSALSAEMVQQMVGLALKTMDKYLPGLLGVEFGDLSTDQALQEVQNWIELQNAPAPMAATQ